MKHEAALQLLARETARARRRLSLERALDGAFALIAAMGAWAALALAGLHDALPWLMQSLSAAGALCVFIWLGWQARRAWRTPTPGEARARLAADSHIDSAAFEALHDRPSRYDALTRALWEAERERAATRVEKARAGPPRLALNRRDPYRLRYALLAALVVSFAAAGANGPDRLARAFLPDPGPLLGDRPMAVEAWAAPANYTRAPPFSLSDQIGKRVTTPPSIAVTVRVTGPAGAPRLVFEGAGQRQSVRFTHAADGAWEARMPIPAAGDLRIVRFHTRARWVLQPAADGRPRAAFAAPIAALPGERVGFAWRAGDDFGVRRVALRVRPISPPPGLLRADPVDTDLESPAGDPREVNIETEIDLAAHPYAGMEVEARIVAFDALGQEGVSDPLRITLPEKVFLQPLARAAIEIRRHILAERRAYREAPRAPPPRALQFRGQALAVRDYDHSPALRRAPAGVRRATRLLDALTMAPADGYFRDLAVFLGLRVARAQLNVAEAIADTDAAADTLWRTALRAEYGGAADARRALEEAQKQLAEALADGAPQPRIRQLIDAMRAAAENYMQALVQEALRSGQQRNMDDTEESAEISGQDIQEMLRQVQRLSQQGRTEEAQAMLQMLAGILSNLDVELQQSQSGEADNGEQDQQMRQSMDELSQAMGEQRALRDETQSQREQEEQRSQSGGGGGEQRGGQGGDDLAERQSQLRQALEAAQRLGEEAGAAPSEALNAAGEAMSRAEHALRQGDFEGAAEAQSAALSNLRQGADARAAELRARQQRGEASGGEQGEGGQRDPLGRAPPPSAAGGGAEGEPMDAMGASDPARARDIFDDIRRRAQDPNRPEAERDYLNRLLDRFGGGS